MSPTAALRINVKPHEHVVIEPQEIDGTGCDYAVIVTGHGPATVRLDGVVGQLQLDAASDYAIVWPVGGA